MSTISGFGTPLLAPTTNTASGADNSSSGEAAETNETTTGTTQANESDTGNTTGSDTGSGGSGASQSQTNTATLVAEPASSSASVPSGQSIVLAQAEPPSSQSTEADARRIAEAAQQAYKLQSILDTLTAAPVDIVEIAPRPATEPAELAAKVPDNGLPV